MKKFFAFGIAAIFLFSLVATVGAYPTGFNPGNYPGIREVRNSYISNIPKIPVFHIVSEDKPTIVYEPEEPTPTPEPEPTPTPVEEDPHEMEFWKWIEDYRLNNRLCPFNPNFEINVPALCPWGLDDTGDWRIFPY